MMAYFVIGFVLGGVVMAGAMAGIFFVWGEHSAEPPKWDDEPMAVDGAIAKVGESTRLGPADLA